MYRLDEDLDDILGNIKTFTPNLELPDPDLRDLWLEEKNRIIWLDDSVGHDSLSIVKKIMNYNIMDKDIAIEERKPIKLLLDTPGGSVDVMNVIINAIKISKTPVWTINFASALSAGAHILAAGHKRFAMPGSTVLVHSGSCQISGTAEQAEKAKEYYDKVSKKADDQLLADTKIDKKLYKKKAPFDWYISAEEALEYGIIDKIIDNFDELA